MDLSATDLTTEVVRTERVVLRPFRPEDVDAVHRACEDPELQRWLPELPSPYTREWPRNSSPPSPRSAARPAPTSRAPSNSRASWSGPAGRTG